MSRLLIIGAGGHGAVVAEAAMQSGEWTEVCFLDDDPSTRSVVGCAVIGNVSQLATETREDSKVIVAIGENRVRLSLCLEIEQQGFHLASVIHPSSVISPTVSVGPGSVVLAGAVINARTCLGKASIVNTGATIDHDCSIGDGVHVSPGVNLAGQVSVGECSWVGIGSAVREGVTVGKNVMIGAGAAVIADTGDHETVVGVPARSIDAR